VKFTVNYKQANGKDGYPNSSTTDSTSLYIVDESDVVKNVTGIATLIDSTVNRPAATTLSIVNSLFDANLGTISDFRIGSNNSGVGSYITFDFKAGNYATLSSVELAPRQDSNYARIKGTVIQGSNDTAAWTTLTAGAVSTMDWQTLPVTGGGSYRYIRIFNGGTWFGNMSEVRFHGTVQGDSTAPVTTATVSPATPASGWYTSDVSIGLAASDSASGVATSYFTVDGGAQQSGNTATLSAKGTHTFTYWSVDKSGNAEQPRSLTVNIGPLDVSASVQLTQQGATLNRATGKYVGSVTVTNNSGATLAGPLLLKLSGLTAGITLDNASGTNGGYPYISLAGPIAAGATVSVPLTFTNPSRALVSYTPVLYKGTF
jgi:hypothetical protein